MNVIYTSPIIRETEYQDQGILCQSPNVTEGMFENVEREEFQW